MEEKMRPSLLRSPPKHFWRSSDENLENTRKQCKGYRHNDDGENI